MTSDARVITGLFVDDEPLILRGISRMLENTLVHVMTATSGADALAILRTRHVDVLVSDIDMPGMNGLELVRLARRESPTTLRFVLTGAGTLDRALTAINEGEITRFFNKPFDPALFRATLCELGERILKLRREGEADAQKARRDQLFMWVEDHFPGALAFERNELGELVVPLETPGSLIADVLSPARSGLRFPTE